MTPGHLRNAPITEALIDFRVNLSSDVGMRQLEEITRSLPPEFTKIDARNQTTTEIRVGPNNSNTVQQSTPNFAGFWCTTEDERNVVQFRPDGFTFSELKPYSNWTEFFEKSRQLWELYKAGTKCDVVTRVALRYINHMELPMKTGDDFDRFLTAGPKIPGTLPQAVGSFLTRVTIVRPDDGIAGHVTQTLISTPDSKKPTVLLDIDVFKQFEKFIGIEEIWDIFPLLRKFKNDIFNQYITDETRKLFE